MLSHKHDRVKMCIIDDIRTVTEGITTQIDWERHGITVSGTALNGEEGWELIESCRPDIILTDIRMPKLDGISMTRKVKERFPSCRVLMITGYNDFEYAQEAVRLGAFDLILKPFSLQHIEEAVLKAKKSLEQELEQTWKLRNMENRVKESLPVLRQEFFQLLIRHKSNKNSTIERLQFLQVDLEPEQLVVMVLEVDRFLEKSKPMSIRDIELTLLALQSILEETLQQELKGIVFRESSSRFVIVINVREDVSALSIAEKCRENVSTYTRYTLSIGLGTVVEDLEEIPQSYEQAIAALSYHFYTGGDGVFIYNDISRLGRIVPAFTREIEQELGLAVRSGNTARAMAILDNVFSRFSTQEPLVDPEYLVSLCYELGYHILRTLQEKIPYTKLEGLEIHLQDIRTSSVTFADLQAQVKEICSIGCGMVESLFQKEAIKAIDHSMQYIRSNLHLDLNIAHCAKQATLSPSYYTNLFKQTTGMTFNNFVTHERMELAKKMLFEDRQVQEISESLGYVNRRYFSDLFRKHTGMTPSEFRQDYLTSGQM
jgi:two-component system response regulator YesN